MRAELMSIVVVGVGQTLRGDDAVGVLAVQAWQDSFPTTASRSEVRAEITELPGLSLLESLSGAENGIIVDAVNSGRPAGEIYVLDEEVLSAFEGGSGFAHGWGVAETIQLGRNLRRDDLPPRIWIIGVEANQFEIGEPLSPEISENMPAIASTIDRLVNKLLPSSF
jgi:hydrogenase maturation protease